MADIGLLQVQVMINNSYEPIEKANITVMNKSKSQVFFTDSSGETVSIGLNAPPLEYSQKPSDKIPYELYDIKIEASGFETKIIRGCQIYPTQKAIQSCFLKKKSLIRQPEEIISIPPNTLVGNYPRKIPENPDKPEVTPSGAVILDEPKIPEYIIVHQGEPDDVKAPNYYIKYKDYIKNVASCEIFSTWPKATIQANIFCIISFTLNRVYTEWYRAKGKNFTITSSTAYDHAFVYGRNIYASISETVDEVFSTYIKRTGKKQPLLTQYCDGIKVNCPGWLTQWGSKFRADLGESADKILKYFYGSDISFDRAKKVEGVPVSYPGYPLGMGSTGMPVRNIQIYLNRISKNYPAIPKLAVNGSFDMNTRKSILEFQKIFFLKQNGIVDYSTWYKISDVYVGVTNIAELRKALFISPIPFVYKEEELPAVFFPKD